MLNKKLIGYRNITITDSKQKLVQIVRVSNVKFANSDEFEYWSDYKKLYTMYLGEIQRMISDGLIMFVNNITFDKNKNLFLLPNGDIIQE